MAGDSFVELGNLPFEQLFTTILGELTHRPVLNLGVSHTGSLTQLCYLDLSLGVIHQALPLAIAEKCSRYGIRFIDLTPALVEEGTRSGELLYNHVFDTHLNARGSEVVAKVLAGRLSND